LCRIYAVVIFIYLLLLACYLSHVHIPYQLLRGVYHSGIEYDHFAVVYIAAIGIYVLLCSRIVHCFDVLWLF